MKPSRELRARGAEVLASTLDVTDENAARRCFDETRDRYQGIDILVNNVGGSRPGGNLSASSDDWQRGFSLNFFSALGLCRLVVPTMQERKRGCVINIASIYRPGMGRTHDLQCRQGGDDQPVQGNGAGARAPTVSGSTASPPARSCFSAARGTRRAKGRPRGHRRLRRTRAPRRPLRQARRKSADVVVFLASDRANWISGACINVDGCQSRSLI